jgi:hypothetical protein
MGNAVPVHTRRQLSQAERDRVGQKRDCPVWEDGRIAPEASSLVTSFGFPPQLPVIDHHNKQEND